VDTLKDVRPTFFFAVPRVWEKFEEKLREFGANKPGALKALANWAKDKGLKGVLSRATHFPEGHSKVTKPWSLPIAKTLVLNRIKAALGLD